MSLTDRQEISGTPSRRTHRTTAAIIIFCCSLHCLMNIATGEDDMRLRTAIISLAVTGWGGDLSAFGSMATSTARLERF